MQSDLAGFGMALFDAVFAELAVICLSAGSEAELSALSDLVA